MKELSKRNWHPVVISDLDADCVFGRNRGEDVDSFRTSGSSEIGFELSDTRDSKTEGRVNLVASNSGAASDVARRDLYAEGAKSLDDFLLRRVEFIVVACCWFFAVSFVVEKVKAWELVVCEVISRERGMT